MTKGVHCQVSTIARLGSTEAREKIHGWGPIPTRLRR